MHRLGDSDVHTFGDTGQLLLIAINRVSQSQDSDRVVWLVSSNKLVSPVFSQCFQLFAFTSWFLVIILQTAPFSGANIGVWLRAHALGAERDLE